MVLLKGKSHRKLAGTNIFHAYPYCSVCFCITIVRDVEGHALSTPLLPKGHESGLGDLSNNGGQVLLVVVAIVDRRRSFRVSISTITATDHRLTLKDIEEKFS